MKTTQPLQYIGWFRCLFLWCGVVWCGVVWYVVMSFMLRHSCLGMIMSRRGKIQS